MADPLSQDPVPQGDAEREARRATDALMRRVASHRRRIRLRARAARLALDLAIAMATYVGITIAAALGAFGGLRMLLGRWRG